jgi:hypothetical protein
LRAVLDRWLDDLDGAEPDADRLRRRFADARARLEEAG